MGDTSTLQELVVDTGPLIEFLGGTSLGLRFEEKVLRNEVILYMSETAVSEVCYILCRQLGVAEARRKMKIFLDSMDVVEGKEVQMLAGEYKCKRAISLSDCFTIAASKSLGVPAMFKKEQELLEEIKKEKFDVEILFVEDL